MTLFRKMSSNQHYAVIVLICSIIYGILGLTIDEQGFFNDPVGSSLWVQGIAVFLILLSLLLLISPPEFIGNFPNLKEWLNRTPFFITIVIYSYILPLLGFVLATPVLMTIISILFKARFISAITSAVVMTIGCYLIFDLALGISLPKGLWWR